MLDTSKLNKVAQIIIECFEEAGYDEPYIYSKIDRLESFGDNRWATFRWASSQLDGTNKAKFALQQKTVEVKKPKNYITLKE